MIKVSEWVQCPVSEWGISLAIEHPFIHWYIAVFKVLKNNRRLKHLNCPLTTDVWNLVSDGLVDRKPYQVKSKPSDATKAVLGNPILTTLFIKIYLPYTTIHIKEACFINNDHK